MNFFLYCYFIFLKLEFLEINLNFSYDQPLSLVINIPSNVTYLLFYLFAHWKIYILIDVVIFLLIYCLNLATFYLQSHPVFLPQSMGTSDLYVFSLDLNNALSLVMILSDFLSYKENDCYWRVSLMLKTCLIMKLIFYVLLTKILGLTICHYWHVRVVQSLLIFFI